MCTPTDPAAEWARRILAELNAPDYKPKPWTAFDDAVLEHEAPYPYPDEEPPVLQEVCS